MFPRVIPVSLTSSRHSLLYCHETWNNTIYLCQSKWNIIGREFGNLD